jgi:cytochrome c biogenesis protein CcmG, thiol:disulfide interchange protein DsbE
MMARMTWARPRRVAVGLLAAGAAVVLIVAVFNRPGLPKFTPTGDPRPLPAEGEFPTVSLKEFEGILVGQHGTPVVVNVWASWCAPCRTEMPLLQRAARTYAGRAVVLGVASKDERGAAKAFLTKLGLTYPDVFDATGEIRVRLGLTAYPTTYVFSADGTLTARISGGISEQRLAALIDDALR